MKVEQTMVSPDPCHLVECARTRLLAASPLRSIASLTMLPSSVSRCSNWSVRFASATRCPFRKPCARSYCSAVAEGVVSTYVEGKESPELDLQPDTYGPDPWAFWSGTSFAAPQVAGAVARLRQEGSPSVSQALRDLLASGRPLLGYGQAIELLQGTGV